MHPFPPSARIAATALFALMVAGCAHPPQPRADADGWHDVALPGKLATRYGWSEKEGRRALSAQSERSASMYRRHVNVPPTALGDVSFSWWAEHLVPGATVTEAALSDAPVRVMFGFDGDTSRLPMRTRAMYELAEALTGEKPPYATLMYTWDSRSSVGSVVVNGRTDRVRKIVLDSGADQLQRWREFRRNLAADYRLAFGEEPGALTSIAVMTDSDNTGTKATAWYGPIVLH